MPEVGILFLIPGLLNILAGLFVKKVLMPEVGILFLIQQNGFMNWI